MRSGVYRLVEEEQPEKEKVSSTTKKALQLLNKMKDNLTALDNKEKTR